MIRVVAATGSTNADLLADAAAPEGTWLRAEQQTAGKGRLDRRWSSAPGNLYASTVVRLREGDPPPSGLALVAGVALEEVASAYAGAGRLHLKWPNDLQAGQAKLAGILLERSGDRVVAGFGVNLSAHPDLPDRPATDLRTIAGDAPAAHDFCLELAAAFARWRTRWRGEGLAPVRAAWLAHAHAVGAAMAVSAADGRLEGLFDGLEPDGSLRLRHASGTIEIVRAGDVRLL